MSSDHPTSRANLKRLAPGLVVLTLLLILVAYRVFSGSPAPGKRMYWYDLSEKKLFVADAGLIPPLEGVGGKPNDAYPAVVITYPDAKERAVAYIENVTDALRALQEEARLAQEAGQPPPEKLGDRLWVTANTLVRTLDSDQWHPKDSPQGLMIIATLTKRGPGGAFPRVCSPDD